MSEPREWIIARDPVLGNLHVFPAGYKFSEDEPPSEIFPVIEWSAYNQACGELSELKKQLHIVRSELGQSRRRKHQVSAARSELEKWKSWAEEARKLCEHEADYYLNGYAIGLLSRFPGEAKDG